MTNRAVLFIRNIRPVIDGLSVEELYQVALALRDTCARRELDCLPETKALTCALLALARVEHASITGTEQAFEEYGIVAALRQLGQPG